MRLSFTTAAFVALAAAAAPAAATAQQTQTENAFTWNARIAPGRWIRIRNLSGSITVGQASGSNVEVTAVKKWRRGDPSVVRFETKKFGSGDESVVICALWGESSSCSENDYHVRGDRRERGMRNNDVSVEFRVLVPRGVRVGASLINGDVTVDGATTDVDVSTINGEVDVASAGGRVSATNVNGNVRARLGKLESDGRMEFTTVNGNVIVEFGGESGADIDMETVMGSLTTNFEMTLSGRFDPKRLRTHIGRPGGPRIKLETVNGNVELRRLP